MAEPAQHLDGNRDGSVLEGRGIKVHFGGVRAVDGVDVSLGQHEILGVIGPNGSGKTTLINVLSGFQDLTEGTIYLDGKDISGSAAHVRARLGIARTFQRARVFARLPVLENVELAALAAGERGDAARRRANELLARFRLEAKADRPASELTHGEERLLGVARAFAAQPKFALLDEPAAGLNEEESAELLGMLRDAKDEYGCGVLIVEHDMSLVMGLCHRVLVMNQGAPIAVGAPDAVRENETVIEAYLGSHAASERSAHTQMVIDAYLGHATANNSGGH